MRRFIVPMIWLVLYIVAAGWVVHETRQPLSVFAVSVAAYSFGFYLRGAWGEL
jgi:hypothetical protein